jgi:hypothetical protein
MQLTQDVKTPCVEERPSGKNNHESITVVKLHKLETT